MLCQFLLYNKVNQLHIYIYPHISSLLRLPPTLPIPPLQVITEHQADLPVLCGCFPLAICFTFGCVYMSIDTLPLSHFVPAYPSPSPCPQVHSLVGLCLYFRLAPRFFMTLFVCLFLRFHIYVLAYGICFPLSDFLLSVGAWTFHQSTLMITLKHPHLTAVETEVQDLCKCTPRQ